MKLILEPVPAQSPVIPVDAKIMVGRSVSPPRIRSRSWLLPGFEYRMSQWRHPETHEVHWRLERRRAGQRGDKDE